MHQFTKVDFHRFKSFKRFTLRIGHFNILVGPNNAGKSTIIAAFRILAAAMRKASAKKATLVKGPGGTILGYDIEISTISVAEENIFFNYDDDEAASVVFNLSNGNSLTLYFPEQGICYLLPDAQGKNYERPSSFKKQFNCPIGFVPILGPVDHHEQLYEKEAARLALFSYTAARNFRNIWHHYPEKFEKFRDLLRQTWPGMDILPPEIDRTHQKPRLHMYCPEERKPRELFWAGFGFQVWCQMLTHIIQSNNVSIFLIDEPDIYLHAELQRQLLDILRSIGTDVILATHSTEMITEAEANDILLINKGKNTAKRIRDPGQLTSVFSAIGSSLNPVLTQVAKTRRVLFVEGKDFQILGRFARKIGADSVGNRRDFAVVPVEGFNPERIRSLKSGMEETLGSSIRSAAILDKDYRSKDECYQIINKCNDFCDLVVLHECKEIENYVLHPAAIERAARRRMAERSKRSGKKVQENDSMDVTGTLNLFCEDRKNYVSAQHIDFRMRFEKENSTGAHSATISEKSLREFEANWKNDTDRYSLVPAKDALSNINEYLSDNFSVNVTASAIIDAMLPNEVNEDMREIIRKLSDFSKLTTK